MKKKLLNTKTRFYLYMAGILWLGAVVQTCVSAVNTYYEPSIEAILMEKEYEGRLTRKELEELALKTFAEEKAEPVQSLSADGMFSAYGYSPGICDYVVSEGERINLNLVASYNEKENRTEIILASPLYNGDY